MPAQAVSTPEDAGNSWLETRLWAKILLYGILPVAAVVLTLAVPSFPLLYILFFGVLLDSFYYGLRESAGRASMAVAAMVGYLTYSYMSRTLNPMWLFHLPFLLAGTILLATLIDRQRRRLAFFREMAEEAERRAKHSERLCELGLRLASGLEHREVFREAAECTREFFGADTVYIAFSNEFQEDTEVWVADREKTEVHVAAGTAQMLSRARALVSVPLVSRGRVLGSLAVVRQPAVGFDAAQTALLQRLAGQIAVAADNAHLYAAARNAVELEERNRLAQEVHDGIAQTVSFLGMRLKTARSKLACGGPGEAAPVLEELEDEVRRLHAEVRRSIAELRLPITVGPGMMESLNNYLYEFSRTHQLATELVIADGADITRLHQGERLHLVRVLQECLANVAKHAQASRVKVTVEASRGELRLRVEDDGCGFDPAALPSGQHYGMQMMRERMEAVGGELRVSSVRQRGTQVAAVFPYRREEER